MHYSQHVHSHSISRVSTQYKDCLKAQCEHIKCWGLLAEQSRAVWEVFRTHIWSARTHRQLCQLCANTKLSSPPQFWAWINKFRQNYIKMHVLVNILVNSRLRKACLNVNSGDKRHVYQYIKSVLSFLKWKKTYNNCNAVKENSITIAHTSAPD